MPPCNRRLAYGLLCGAMLCLMQLTVPACGHNIPQPQVSPLSIVDRRYNDYALLVAALPQEDGSVLATLAATGWYGKYRENAEDGWRKLERERLAQMRSWSESELGALNREGNDVLYTFSGPDFLHMFTLFPNARRYVMIALEPAGSLPDLARLREAEITSHLGLFEKSLGDLHKRSYFITSNLNRNLSTNDLDGVLPLLCAFLARTGNRIIDIKYVRLSEAGEPVAEPVIFLQRRQSVRIDFVNDKNLQEVRTLLYVSADLSDRAFRENMPLRRYLEGMKGSVAYIKSASYLMHSSLYAAIRSVILDRCSAYVGDDTGIPYAHFAREKWAVQLYGKYVRPIDEFTDVDQDDLRRAYETTAVKPLPFNLGYHWLSKEQNLMVTIRKQAGAQPRQ